MDWINWKDKIIYNFSSDVSSKYNEHQGSFSYYLKLVSQPSDSFTLYIVDL
jgi:hypothetical protein